MFSPLPNIVIFGTVRGLNSAIFVAVTEFISLLKINPSFTTWDRNLNTCLVWFDFFLIVRTYHIKRYLAERLSPSPILLSQCSFKKEYINITKKEQSKTGFYTWVPKHMVLFVSSPLSFSQANWLPGLWSSAANRESFELLLLLIFYFYF